MVTAVFTSFGRLDSLSKTINSFIKYNTYPIDKYIIIDNSTIPNIYDGIKSIVKDLNNTLILVNEENIGQVASIDKAYSYVDTEYIFHSEDDWLFLATQFIEKSLAVLEYDSNLVNINLRIRFDGERGSMHPVLGPFKTPNNIIYYEYEQNYLTEWHGFSWNPGLRRLADYKLIGNYKKYINEQGVNAIYKELGRKSGCLENYYSKHIGGDIVTAKSNS